MFLHCWRISLVCLALKLVGSWVELGFSVGMQAFRCAFGVGDGQGGLACCDSWGRKESDMTQQLICSDLMEVFDKLLSINVPWSQEFSGVLRILT